tara:strand:- start:3 stop:677 length:675 start_codon:yes stop_codon:yes gene_type:complete
MNSKTTIIGLVAAIAVLSGAMGMSVTGTFSDLKTAEYSPISTSTGMLLGHVEIEARHADGELYDYRQLDNAVVDDGEQCILKMLFGSDGPGRDGRGEYASGAGTAACTGALTGAWDVIAIGTGTDAAIEADVKLGTESTTNGAARGVATTKTWGNLTAGIPQIVMSKTFTATGGDIGAVTESGLFNSTTAGAQGMLARNVFSAVTLADGDSITITWTFKVGNDP